MAKRANGEGSIRKRKDGKWLVTFPTGLYKDDGKREYIYNSKLAKSKTAQNSPKTTEGSGQRQQSIKKDHKEEMGQGQDDK